MKSNQKVVLIGAGVMSATLAFLLKQLNPKANIKIFEMSDYIADESSGAMNNAGTGHSGFCELNYTPQAKDGSVDVHKAIEVANEFLLSKEFWAYCIEQKYIESAENFINQVPHYSFVNNKKDVEFLNKRFNALKDHPLFANMKYSEDFETVKSWLPLIMNGRKNNEKIAATKVSEGADVNFEVLTKSILNNMQDRNELELHCGHMVKDLNKNSNNQWEITIQNVRTKEIFIEEADFVFIGAGGGSIFLLEKSRIPEASGYGSFPVGGEWLVCENETLAKKHQAKVYGQAKIGAPPMSVPHLDSRIIEGKEKLLFGPFALFSTKFLKHGSHLDLFKSLQVENLSFMSQAGFRNMDLTKYLIKQASQNKSDKIKELKKYFPEANESDWKEVPAGQRVQVIKKDKDKGGVLQFGTEIVTSQDGSLSVLLGASPGASTAVAIMLKIIKQCFNEDYESNEWTSKLKEIVPSLYVKNDQDLLTNKTKVNQALKLNDE